MGSRRKTRGQIVNGILLLDKPSGITSNRALQTAKRLYGARKAGHTGSLDPLATGLLPLCFGQATKISAYMLGADKHYQVQIILGQTTDTGDADGEVLLERPLQFDAADLQRAIAQFTGAQEQMPPMYSALKQQGVPLYKLARQGIEVERKRRAVTAHSISVLEHDQERLQLMVHCSSGFYIRALAEDIGEALGCGAHVSALRRTQIGDLKLEQAYTLEQIESLQTHAEKQNCLMPSDAALIKLPAVYLSENALFYLLRGQAVRAENLPATGTVVRLYDEGEQFLGLGEVGDLGTVCTKRLMIDTPEEPGPEASN